jgi:hypothetical protein
MSPLATASHGVDAGGATGSPAGWAARRGPSVENHDVLAARPYSWEFT